MRHFDVFISYAHADRERVLGLRDALVEQGMAVWLDESEVETFQSISVAIEQALAGSRVLLAFYSRTYPTRRACQWELTAAFLAAQRGGLDPRARVLVVNPEPGSGHIEQVELRDALFAPAPAAGDDDGHAALADQVADHVASLDGVLGDLGVGVRPLWAGCRPVGATHFVRRQRDMWAVHSALTDGRVGAISGAHVGDPAVSLTGMGGIGKSLLALEYALRFGASHPGGVFWLRAHGHDDRGDTLTTEQRDDDRVSQLAEFAAQLGVATAELKPEHLAFAVGMELDRRGEPLLWVVDDLPGGMSAAEFEAWLAPSRLGRTLITTRSRDYHAIGAQIDLGVLDTEEGYELLVGDRPPHGEAEREAALGIVGDLGGHALALDVARAALRAERGVRSFSRYRAALADPPATSLRSRRALRASFPAAMRQASRPRSPAASCS